MDYQYTFLRFQNIWSENIVTITIMTKLFNIVSTNRLQCDPLKFKYNFNHLEFLPRQL